MSQKLGDPLISNETLNHKPGILGAIAPAESAAAMEPVTYTQEVPNVQGISEESPLVIWSTQVVSGFDPSALSINGPLLGPLSAMSNVVANCIHTRCVCSGKSHCYASKR